MKPPRRAIAAVLAVLVVQGVSVLGCADPDSWELKGEVEFIELRETIDNQGLKKATLDFAIYNRGKSTIEGSSIAFTFSTDKNAYHLTIIDTNEIKGGALIYGQVSIIYDEADEGATLAGAVLDSVQFK
jgi:hypothetical protein